MGIAIPGGKIDLVDEYGNSIPHLIKIQYSALNKDTVFCTQ